MFNLWFLRSNLSLYDVTATLAALIFCILFVLPLHEIIHLVVYRKLTDDDIPNPYDSWIDMFDPWGAVSLLIFFCGWSKQIYLPYMGSEGKSRSVLIGLSGILFYFLYAVLAGIFSNLTNLILITLQMNFRWIILFFDTIFGICIRLSVINFLPIPPFDGFRIGISFLPGDSFTESYRRYMNFTIIFYVLLLFGLFDVPLGVLEGVSTLLARFISSAPFSFTK